MNSASYYFPNVNNCDAGGSVNGSDAMITVMYDLDSGSGALDPSNIQVHSTFAFSNGTTINQSSGHVFDVTSSSFVLRDCLLFDDASYVNIDFRLWSGSTPVSNTKSITVYRPSGGN